MKNKLLYRLIFLSAMIIVTGIYMSGCAVVRDTPQTDTTYAATGYQGQVPQSTMKELEKKYPPGFWKEKTLNIPMKDRINIGIKEFTNATQQQDLEKTITEIFITAFSKSGAFNVIERQQLEKVLNEFELSQSGIIDTSTSKEIGQLTGVEAIVTGTVSQMGNNQRVDARVIDISTGRVVIAERTDQANNTQRINLLARRLINRMIDKYYR